MSRRSLIPRRKVAFATAKGALCGGCWSEISNPGLARRGKVLAGVQRMTLRDIKLDPSKRGKDMLIPTERVIRFPKYVRALLCDKCAMCYTNVEGPGGRPIPLVIAEDMLPPARDHRQGSFVGSSTDGVMMERPTFRRGPAFNTRVTQGRRGARV